MYLNLFIEEPNAAITEKRGAFVFRCMALLEKQPRLLLKVYNRYLNLLSHMGR